MEVQMKSFAKLISAAVVVLFFQTQVLAAGHELGIAIGTPSHISYQYNLNEQEAFNLGLSYDSDHFLYLSGDYHWVIQSFGKPYLKPYVGIGAFVALHTQSYDDSRHDYYGVNNPNTVVAARIPFGLEYRPKDVPLTIFGELGPSLTLTPSTAGFFQLALGVRFRF
jgi:hypothetical protein